MIKANGDIYEGEFKNGKFDGCGNETLQNGNSYLGEWKNDLKNGRGINYI